jgi:hypothetical protein
MCHIKYRLYLYELYFRKHNQVACCFFCLFGSWLLRHHFPCCYWICNDMLQLRKLFRIQNSPAVSQWMYEKNLSEDIFYIKSHTSTLKFENCFFYPASRIIHNRRFWQYLKYNHCNYWKWNPTVPRKIFRCTAVDIVIIIIIIIIIVLIIIHCCFHYGVPSPDLAFSSSSFSLTNMSVLLIILIWSRRLLYGRADIMLVVCVGAESGISRWQKA